MLSKADKELSEIGQEITIKDHKMRAYEVGEGQKTIVLLSALGTYSPILDFKPLADELGRDYKVVVLEYFGYGLSDDTDEERTAENIVSEIREAMQVLKIKPPYVLMPHSVSGLYALQYIKSFPEEVEAVVGIEMSVPKMEKYIGSVQITPAAQFIANMNVGLGLTRMRLTKYGAYFDEVAKQGNYSESEMNCIKEMYARKRITKALASENNHFLANCQALSGMQLPETMPSLQFLCTESNESFKEQYPDDKEELDWEQLHTSIYSNPELQKVVVLEGSHYLHQTQWAEMARQTKDFIEQYYKS